MYDTNDIHVCVILVISFRSEPEEAYGRETRRCLQTATHHRRSSRGPRTRPGQVPGDHHRVDRHRQEDERGH